MAEENAPVRGAGGGDDAQGRLEDEGLLVEEQPRGSGESEPRRTRAEAVTLVGPTVRDRVLDYLNSSWPWIVVVALIMIVATVLRFWDLAHQGFWFDELFSASVTRFGPAIAIKATAQDTNPPLYYVIQAMLVPFLGQSEWAMRVLPAILGVATTGVVYLAGRKLFGRPTGAIAASLFAVSGLALQYAQEARMYSLLAFFAALTLWTFGRLVEKPTVLRAFVLGVVLAATGYTHVYGYMAMPMLIIPTLFLPRLQDRIWPKIAVSYLTAIVLFAPWIFVIPQQVALVRSQVSNGGWWMKAPTDLGASLVSNLNDFSPGQTAFPAAIFLALFVAGFAVQPPSLPSAPRRKRRRSKARPAETPPGEAAPAAEGLEFAQAAPAGEGPEVAQAASATTAHSEIVLAETAESDSTPVAETLAAAAPPSAPSLGRFGDVRDSDLEWTLVVLALVPMFVGLAVSKYVTPIATTRNTLVCLPAAYILASRGVLKLWRPVGILALAATLLYAALQLPAFYTENTKGYWREATTLVTAQPKTGVLVQEWETDFNLETYASILRGDGVLNAIWVNNADATPAPQGRQFNSDQEVAVPTFAKRWDQVWVVSQTSDSSVADYMKKLPGWKLSATKDLGTPVLRLYTKVAAQGQ